MNPTLPTEQPDFEEENPDFDGKAYRNYLNEVSRKFKGEELKEFAQLIHQIKNFPYHSYNTIVDGIVVAMMATLKYCGDGITGFQAECIAYEILRRIESIDGPYRVVKFENLLYPQFVDRFPVKQLTPQVTSWLRDNAKELLEKTSTPNPHPDVKEHWELLAAGNLPKGFVEAPDED